MKSTLALDVAATALGKLPPWWAVRLYHRGTGAPFRQGGYRNATRRASIRPHGYSMDLRLDDWSERLAYACRCYYDVEGTALLVALLREGDSLVDVGANVGFITLTAARLVGPSGRVASFEPNPSLATRLRRTLDDNDIRHVVVHDVALGSSAETARLSADSHTGTANLRRESDSGVSVRVVVGDDYLPPFPPDRPLFLKLDVEGYEFRALRGLVRLIEAHEPAILVEVTDTWLRETGSSAAELFEFMAARNLEGFRLKATPLMGLHLQRIREPARSEHQYDVLFLPKGGAWRARATRLISS